MGALIGDTLLSMWIWNVTAGWFQFFISFLIMTTLLRMLSGDGIFRSVLIAGGCHVLAFVALHGIVVGILVKLLGWTYHYSNQGVCLTTTNAFRIGIWLAVFYVFVQSLFFMILQKLTHYRAWAYIVTSLFSNTMGALLGYGCVVLFLHRMM